MIVPDEGAFVTKTIRSEYQEYFRTLSFKTCIWVFFLFSIPKLALQLRRKLTKVMAIMEKAAINTNLLNLIMALQMY